MWDVFINHASEDKVFARQLADELTKQGLKVWFDEMTLKLGDRLSEKIDQGLRDSRFGIVIFSQAFFNKSWTRHELEGLVYKELSSGKTILPIWHNVTVADVAQFSPSLANKLAVSSQNGMSQIVSQIMDVVRPNSYATQSSDSNQGKIVNHYYAPLKMNTYDNESSGQVSKSHLREIITNYFSSTELRTIAFDLDVDYESFSGRGKSETAIDLIQFLERRGRLNELVAIIRSQRPNISI